MLQSVHTVYELVKETATEWISKGVPRLGAALAFYTLFAIAPLIVLVVAIAGFWFGQEAAEGELFSQISGMVGPEGGKAIQAIVSAANRPQAGAWATAIAVTTLFIGATSVFIQLQDALNFIWGVRRKPGSGLHHFVKNRILSFAMIMGIGFLLLVSLLLSAGLSALDKVLIGLLPAQETIWQGVNFIVSFGVITLLFAMIFKVLPDVKIAWRDVWVGAAITAMLFNVGKLLLGLYLGQSSVASVYGAAGSLVIVLLWVYYSAQILFFGAKFTQIYASRFGSKFEPLPGAEAVDMISSSSLGA